MAKTSKKKAMADGFDAWTSNGIGLKVISKPKKKQPAKSQTKKSGNK